MQEQIQPAGKVPPEGQPVNRKRALVVGIGVLAGLILAAACFWAVLLFVRARLLSEQLRAGQALLELTLCRAQAAELCIISFGREVEGKALITIHLPAPSFPDIYLRIRRNGMESIYECTRVEDFPDLVYCRGDEILLGESLEVEILLEAGDYLVARGTLTVPFLALATAIQVRATPSSGAGTATPPAPCPPAGSPQLQCTPTPRVVRTATPRESYPNP